MKRGSTNDKISILNGFYWRILKSKGTQVRKYNILAFIYFDILGIKEGHL